MNLEQFYEAEKARLERWHSWWLDRHKDDPNNYPVDKLTSDEWRIEYEIYDEEGPQE